MLSTVSDELQQQYEDSIDEWIFDSIKHGARSFKELLLSLPSVYPMVALDSLRRLASSHRISGQMLAGIIGAIGQAAPPHISRRPSSQQIQLPVPHPLDYDWRFGDKAIEHIADLYLRLTQPGDRVILLGIPSVFQMAGALASSRQIILLDANPTLAALATTIPADSIEHCNLLQDPLPQIEAPVIILDPPWYEEHLASFLWAASRLCALNGKILVSLPPVGTRPGIEQERTRVFKYACKLGLILTSCEPAVLPYTSPPFELNALRTAGILNFPEHWRRGDLTIFSKTQQVKISRPSLARVEDGAWSEETIGVVRLRIRQSDEISFADPTLITVVKGDVLPSVSRRDTRRAMADVWTAGNRIFACRGRNVLRWIIRAIATDKAPETEVIAHLGRNLIDDETMLVSQTALQITKLVKQEQYEYQP